MKVKYIYRAIDLLSNRVTIGFFECDDDPVELTRFCYGLRYRLIKSNKQFLDAKPIHDKTYEMLMKIKKLKEIGSGKRKYPNAIAINKITTKRILIILACLATLIGGVLIILAF